MFRHSGYAKSAQRYAIEKKKSRDRFRSQSTASARRGEFPPLTGKRRLEDLRARYAGYTDSELRSMIVRLGVKHPERLETRMELIEALDEVSIAM